MKICQKCQKIKINKLLNNFKKGIPLNRPKILVIMANQVADQLNSKKDENIKEWAKELSKDVSKLSD